jgi:hypothetical protein
MLDKVKDKETCKWNNLRNESFYGCDDKYISGSDCEGVVKFIDKLCEMEFKYCPYCGKEIEEIKE